MHSSEEEREGYMKNVRTANIKADTASIQANQKQAAEYQWEYQTSSGFSLS